MRRIKRSAFRNDSPFATWLIDQVKARDKTLAELGHRAGLSTGTLRGIVVTPNRQPTVDTCLRLARALNVPYEKVLAVAGLSPTLPDSLDMLDPDRIELMQLYDELPQPARRTLVNTAKVMSDYLCSV
ncbi:MAG: helix-turn-helix transcriptional regulator [Thermoflexales bacterium]|nr:helix-turn-helix transcriptional regulator [Thermoflexales bacterium]